MNRTMIYLAIALAAVVCYQSLAVKQMAALRPANVVWVDIERVFEGLNARAAGDQALQTLKDKLEADAEIKRGKAEAKKEELEVLSAGTPAYKAAEEAWAQLALEYRGYQEFANLKMEREKARILGDIYDKIRKGAQKLAEEQGFDYVFINDTLGQLQANTQEEMNRQISARRMLYANPEFDATDMLIALMNRP